MNDLHIAVLVLIVALVAFACKRAYASAVGSRVKIVSVRSNVDGRTYSVQDKADKQEAANMLARVRGKMMSLIDCLKRTGGAGVKGSEDEKKFGDYATRVERLTSRFDPDKIAEGNEDPKYTTYTLNKGEKMVFCLRARGQDDRVHDLEMMTFVAIHEMGHVASVTEHHTDEFHANFKWLLESAVKCGIYRPENFKKNPRKYCGITVSDSPLH